MARIKNKNTYKIGDIVWWFDQWSCLRHGEIYEMGTETVGKLAPVKYAKIHERDDQERRAGSTGAKLSDCWPSKEACLDAARRKAELETKEYLDSIKTVDDLVRFMYHADINSEFPNCEAKTAIQAKAKELLGIELTD